MITQKLMSPVDINNSFTFSRPSVASTSDGRLVNPNNARYEAGPSGFGNGIKIEEGTTNLAGPDIWRMSESSWSGTITTTYLPQFKNSASVNWGVSTGSGSYCYINWRNIPQTTWDTTKQYTLSIWLRTSTASAIAVAIQDGNGLNTVTHGVTFNPTSSWALYQFTFTPLITGVNPWVYITTGMSNAQFDIGDVQIEQKAYATTFDVATRAEEFLTIPNAKLGLTGTVEVILQPLLPSSVVAPTSYPQQGPYYNNSYFGFTDLCFFDTNNGFIVRRSYTNANSIQLTGVVGGVITSQIYTINYNAGDVIHLALTWDGTNITLYINGVAQTATVPCFSVLPSTDLYLGGRYNSGSISFGNALYTDFRLSPIARTGTELSTNGTATSPLPVDANTTLKLNFNGPDAVRGAKSLNLGAL